MEMALRMQSNRMKIENAHNAVVFTVAPKTPRSLYKQRVRWVTGFLKNAFFNYRHMFFNGKYGNLGMLTLPFAFISIFVALTFTALWIKSLSHTMYVKYLQYSAMGFNFDLGPIHFDWFSMNLEFRRLIIYIMFFTTVFFLLIGARMLTRRWHASRNMVYFILLYGFIAPFWLARSLFNFITTREAKWR
jgi:cellulose synthase/poly-beta-1,6-N-acetylglucosamine synthase-like glycosyltransferase